MRGSVGEKRKLGIFMTNRLPGGLERRQRSAILALCHVRLLSVFVQTCQRVLSLPFQRNRTVVILFHFPRNGLAAASISPRRAAICPEPEAGRVRRAWFLLVVLWQSRPWHAARLVQISSCKLRRARHAERVIDILLALNPSAKRLTRAERIAGPDRTVGLSI